MPNVYEPLVLTIEPPYIGSAFSPTVDITETSDDVTVTITDSRGEHSYTVDKTDQAIADAEAAADNANQAAAAANTAASNASTAAARANASADDADDATAAANTAAAAATEAAEATEEAIAATNAAASTASTAAANADAATAATEAAISDAEDATAAANAAAASAVSTAEAAAAQAVDIAQDAADAAEATASAAASNADAKAALANTSAAAAITAASSASTAATAANSAASAASTAATTANTAAEAADAAREAIQDDLAAKADADGYYQLLTAGMADTLKSQDTETAEFMQRVSGHDGGVAVQSIRGKTVRWNQLNNNGLIPSSNAGVSIAAKSGGTLTINGTSTAQSATSVNIANVKIEPAHVYLLKGAPTGGGSGIYEMNVSGVGHDYGNGTIFSYSQGIANGKIRMQFAAGTTFSDVDFTPQIFDLTAMFGAGNEPSTVAEFEAMFPEDYYPYDAGSLLSVNVEGIESAGVTREIPAATYFANGMNGITIDNDELSASKATQRIGTYELKSSSISAGAMNNAGFFRIACYDVSPKAKETSAYALSNKFDYLAATYNSGQELNFTIIGNTAYFTLPSSVTTLQQAKDWVDANQPIICNYKLATPIQTPIDPPLNIAYPTEQGGTESFVIPTGEQSAPPTIVYTLAYDADGVRDEAQSIVATVEGATASTNYAIGSYFVHGGKLYKATSAIATGETINPGTNCIATTVMAELISLTA